MYITCFYYWYIARKNLKSTQKTIEVMSGNVPDMTLAQNEMNSLEVEYYAEECKEALHLLFYIGAFSFVAYLSYYILIKP